MPVFFAKEQHVLIQLESEDDWLSLFNSCEGYMTLLIYYIQSLIHPILRNPLK